MKTIYTCSLSSKNECVTCSSIPVSDLSLRFFKVPCFNNLFWDSIPLLEVATCKEKTFFWKAHTQRCNFKDKYVFNDLHTIINMSIC